MPLALRLSRGGSVSDACDTKHYCRLPFLPFARQTYYRLVLISIMAGLGILASAIYHERQTTGSMLCAQHALNSLLRKHTAHPHRSSTNTL
jgi:hypothetical protein